MITVEELLDEAARFIDGFARSAESGLARRRRAEDWMRYYHKWKKRRPDGEAVAAVPILEAKPALVLYFDTAKDRDELSALLQAAKPNMRTVNL